MNRTRRKIAVYFTFILLGLILFNGNLGHVNADANEALLRYQYAKDAVITAYNYLTRVYELGLNVGESLVNLNNALNMLTQSEIAYRNGDYNLAYSLADDAYNISLVQVATLSALMGERTIIVEITDSQIAALIIKISILTASAYFLWIRIEKWYINKMLSLKPEIVNNEY